MQTAHAPFLPNNALKARVVDVVAALGAQDGAVRDVQHHEMAGGRCVLLQVLVGATETADEDTVQAHVQATWTAKAQSSERASARGRVSWAAGRRHLKRQQPAATSSQQQPAATSVRDQRAGGALTRCSVPFQPSSAEHESHRGGDRDHRWL